MLNLLSNLFHELFTTLDLLQPSNPTKVWNEMVPWFCALPYWCHNQTEVSSAFSGVDPFFYIKHNADEEGPCLGEFHNNKQTHNMAQSNT